MKNLLLLGTICALYLTATHAEQDGIQEVGKKLDNFIDYVMTRDGWFKASDHHWYKVSRGRAAYERAKAACISLGGRLASAGMRDPTIRSTVVDNLLRPLGYFVWVGLDDLAEQFSWRWLDGEQSTDENTFWAEEEPNNWNERGERCAAFDYRQNRWALNDDLCRSRYHYLCELEL